MPTVFAENISERVPMIIHDQLVTITARFTGGPFRITVCRKAGETESHEFSADPYFRTGVHSVAVGAVVLRPREFETNFGMVAIVFANQLLSGTVAHFHVELTSPARAILADDTNYPVTKIWEGNVPADSSRGVVLLLPYSGES